MWIFENLVETIKWLKLLYSTTDDFFEKSSNHLKEGDCAQACEKLFGVMEFSLRSYVNELCQIHRSYVNELCQIHSIKDVPSDNSWDYKKYRKLCRVVNQILKERGEDDFLLGGFQQAYEWAFLFDLLFIIIILDSMFSVGNWITSILWMLNLQLSQ
jgi:hypothetical protein